MSHSESCVSMTSTDAKTFMFRLNYANSINE